MPTPCRLYALGGVSGLAEKRKSRLLGTGFLLFRADQMNDPPPTPPGSPWMVRCVEHGSVAHFRTKKEAIFALSNPGWCQECHPLTLACLNREDDAHGAKIYLRQPDNLTNEKGENFIFRDQAGNVVAQTSDMRLAAILKYGTRLFSAALVVSRNSQNGSLPGTVLVGARPHRRLAALTDIIYGIYHEQVTIPFDDPQTDVFTKEESP